MEWRINLFTPMGEYSGNIRVPENANSVRTLDMLNKRQVMPGVSDPLLEDFLEIYDVITPHGEADVSRIRKRNIIVAYDENGCMGCPVERKRMYGSPESMEFYLTNGWQMEGNAVNFAGRYKSQKFIALAPARLGNLEKDFMALNKDYIIDYSKNNKL